LFFLLKSKTRTIQAANTIAVSIMFSVLKILSKENGSEAFNWYREITKTITIKAIIISNPYIVFQ
jgi:hypothetical protein